MTDDRGQISHLVGIFFVSASSIVLEVCLSRLLAVTLWYHFAFMIISGGLLGFGAASVTVSLWRRLRQAPLDRTLAALAATMAIAAPGSFALAQAIPLRPFSLADDLFQILYFALFYLLLTFPFFLTGLGVSLLLARQVRSVTLLYGLDLTGAGLGAVGALALLSALGAPAALVLAGALAAAGAVAFAWPLGGKARAAGLALVVLLGWLAVTADDWLPLRISENKGLGRVAEVLSGHGPRLTRWSATGRADVIDGPRGEPRILIDGGAAATRVPRIEGPVERWTPPPEGMAAAMAAVEGEAPVVLVIGSGGGYEVASALALGARRVVAVEMNEAIVELVRDDLAGVTGGLLEDRRVEVVVDEGRSYVRRTSEPVDVIACVHTISNAAWASGALSLAENYTLTVEALGDFLDHLTPGGVLWLTRPEAQLPRLIATVREALARRGAVAPDRHIVAYRRPGRGRSFLGGLIVTRRPMSDELVARSGRRLARSRLQPLMLPGREPVGLDAEAYRAALSGEDVRPFRRELGVLTPATDERPYFNQRLPWTELGLEDLRSVLGRGRGARMAMEDAPVAEVAVLIVLVWACLFSLALVLVPLRALRRSAEGALLSLGDGARLVTYFVALGLGYITVEVCLIQRLGLFVGRPEYALSVVLGSMLVSSGVGSLLSTRWSARPGRAAPAALAVAALLIVAHAELVPAVTEALLGMSLSGRMAVAALLIFPLGCALGMPLPLGLRATPERADRLRAWVFGLNCGASVVGSTLAVILSSSIGFGATLEVAAAVYLLAALVVRRGG